MYVVKKYLNWGLEGVTVNTVEFFYNLLFSAKLWQDPSSIDREKQK